MGERGKKPRKPCKPGYMCFTCDRPDCDFPVYARLTDEEKKITSAGTIGIDENNMQPQRTPEERKEHHRQSSVELMKMLRQLRKENGLCVSCGKRPPAEGRLQCKACLEKHKKYKYSKEKRRTYNSNRQKRREKWKKEGLCVSCGKRPPAEGRLQCEECLARQSAQRKKKKKAKKKIPTNI